MYLDNQWHFAMFTVSDAGEVAVYMDGTNTTLTETTTRSYNNYDMLSAATGSDDVVGTVVRGLRGATPYRRCSSWSDPSGGRTSGARGARGGGNLGGKPGPGTRTSPDSPPDAVHSGPPPRGGPYSPPLSTLRNHSELQARLPDARRGFRRRGGEPSLGSRF